MSKHEAYLLFLTLCQADLLKRIFVLVAQVIVASDAVVRASSPLVFPLFPLSLSVLAVVFIVARKFLTVSLHLLRRNSFFA